MPSQLDIFPDNPLDLSVGPGAAAGDLYYAPAGTGKVARLPRGSAGQTLLMGDEDLPEWADLALAQGSYGALQATDGSGNFIAIEGGPLLNDDGNVGIGMDPASDHTLSIAYASGAGPAALFVFDTATADTAYLGAQSISWQTGTLDGGVVVDAADEVVILQSSRGIQLSHGEYDVATNFNTLDDGIDGSASFAGTLTVGGVAYLEHDVDFGDGTLTLNGTSITDWPSGGGGGGGSLPTITEGDVYLSDGAGGAIAGDYPLSVDPTTGVVSAEAFPADDYSPAVIFQATYDSTVSAISFGSAMFGLPAGPNYATLNVGVPGVGSGLGMIVVGNGGFIYSQFSKLAIQGDTIFQYGTMQVNVPATFSEVVSLGSFLVSALPAGSDGQLAYASNGCKVGEITGSGTGVSVQYYESVEAWCLSNTTTPVTD